MNHRTDLKNRLQAGTNGDGLRIINFNTHFRLYLTQWLAKHPEIADDDDALADELPELYEHWLHTKKPWLGGMSPIRWFARIDDPQLYLTLLIEYAKRDMKAPEPLADCLVAYAETSFDAIVNLLAAEPTPDLSADALLSVKGQLAEIISEAGLEPPIELYISLLSEMDEDNEFGEKIVESLRDEGRKHADAVFAAFGNVTAEYARLAFMDVISDYIGDKRAEKLMTEEFMSNDDALPFIADCLGRLKCKSALPMLQNALTDPAIDYFGYVSVLSAIESIIGRTYTGVGADREFSGDSMYDMMLSWEDGTPPTDDGAEQ